MRWRTTSACVLWLWLLSSAFSPLQAQFSSEFDEYFKQTTLDYLYGYLPESDWRLWQSQCWVESRLKADAVSSAGASGLCQIMPLAAVDATLSWADRFDAERNIRAGAWILRRNIRAWWPRPTRWDRWRLGASAYNSGLGIMLKAQRDCGGAHLWQDIEPCIPYRETREYVPRIESRYAQTTGISYDDN